MPFTDQQKEDVFYVMDRWAGLFVRNEAVPFFCIAMSEDGSLHSVQAHESAVSEQQVINMLSKALVNMVADQRVGKKPDDMDDALADDGDIPATGTAGG